jgi:UDP-N-acetylmuramate: L-alanyl-gamma-D-glutamyl-meso-diaminopimelate ligase
MKNNDSTPCAELLPDLNKIPPDIRHIHLMGICGVGMASLAGILKERGYTVTGSDQNIYPPMSHFLEDLSIPVIEGYDAENLHPVPDLVIVGNVITKENPEAVEFSRLGISYLSLPQALRAFAMNDAKSIVICGTHGKTTTSALAAWALEKAGMDPGFMIGGIPKNFQRNFKLGDGPYFVVEGDEYDTAFFDKGPKFLHYSPWIVILTSIEFDHADIYRDLGHLLESFRKLIQLIPSKGLLIANGDDPVILDESKQARCRVITYGLSRGVEWRATAPVIRDDFTTLRILKGNSEYMTLSTPLYGNHNISNLLSIVALSDHLRMNGHVFSEAMKNFNGIKRRQEIKGEKRGILVLDDFAHHPTAVRETISAVKGKYNDHRLLAVFEPRSNSSRRKIFQERYADSFEGADMTFVPEPSLMEKIPEAERFSSSRLVEDLKKRGLQAFYSPDTDHLLDAIIREARAGDIVLIMSNGSFDHLHDRLLEKL